MILLFVIFEFEFKFEMHLLIIRGIDYNIIKKMKIKDKVA